MEQYYLFENWCIYAIINKIFPRLTTLHLIFDHYAKKIEIKKDLKFLYTSVNIDDILDNCSYDSVESHSKSNRVFDSDYDLYKNVIIDRKYKINAVRIGNVLPIPIKYESK